MLPDWRNKDIYYYLHQGPRGIAIHDIRWSVHVYVCVFIMMSWGQTVGDKGLGSNEAPIGNGI